MVSWKRREQTEYVMTASSERLLVFLSRQEMWPSQINAEFPDAQFLARARTSVASNRLDVAESFRTHIVDDCWGVLISTDQIPEATPSIVSQTDDGREYSASFIGGTALEGDPNEVLRVCRYWELPPEFIQHLKTALTDAGMPVEDEDPRDDGALG